MGEVSGVATLDILQQLVAQSDVGKGASNHDLVVSTTGTIGVKVNSGFRHPDVNGAVGGSKTSDHCKGMAADIEIPGVANADLAEWISENLEFRQLILEFYTPGIPDSGWVHVSYNPEDNKKQIMTAMKENGKTVYKSGLIA